LRLERIKKMTAATATIKMVSSQELEPSNMGLVKLQKHEVYTGCNPFYREGVIRESYAFNSQSDVEQYLRGDKFKELFLKRFLKLRSFLPRNGLDKKFIRRLDSPEGVKFSEALMESILAVEAATAFARHELNAVKFAGRKTFDDHFDIIWASQSPSLSSEIAEVALMGLLELLPEELYPANKDTKRIFSARLKALLKRAARRKMAASTAVVKLAAIEQGIPCELVGTQNLILGQGAKQQHLYASMTSTTPITAQKICADKRQTNRRLSELRLPVPEHTKVGSVKGARRAAKELGLPIIIKPVKGQKGRDISDQITSLSEIDTAFKAAHVSGNDVLVEKYIEGDDYRLLVIDGKFHSALLRKPPVIIGDGVSKVTELIDQMNKDPYRDRFRGFPVEIDDEISARLSQAGVAPDDVLDQGREIVLRLRANVSTGGTPRDVTKLVHPEVRAMAERAAKAVQLTVAGIDYLTTDVDRSPVETGGVIIEVNARPGLDIHVWPHAGKSRDVGGSLINHLFPAQDSGRIPVIASAGDRGTGTPARLVDALLRGVGKRVALSMTSETYADGIETQLSRKQQEIAPLVLLRDPEIDALVSTISLRQTAKRGMLLDHSDVSIIMDRAKSGSVKAFLAGMEVIVQATSRCFVVGAGNLVALKRIEKLNNSAELVLVSPRKNDPSLQKHLSDGHTGITTNWQDNGQNIVIQSGDKIIASFSLQGLPGKFSGRSKGINEGMLYAIGAAYGYGMTSDEIANSLKMLRELVTLPKS
jgi:cyanophycin synthetase